MQSMQCYYHDEGDGISGNLTSVGVVAPLEPDMLYGAWVC